MRTARLDPVLLLAVPAVLFFAIVYGLPIINLIGRSFIIDGWPTIASFTRFFADGFNWIVIWNTLRIALLTTLVCLVIGYPAAVALARSKGLAQILILVAIILPLSVGVVVKAFAWQIVLRRDGVVSMLMTSLGLWNEPQRLLFTEAGLVIGAANVFLPFMILPIYSVLRLIDPRLDEAAATLGASPFYRFFRVTLPLSLPGIVSGIAFVFSMAASMYVIPTLLIGDRFQTLATLTGRSFLFMRNEQLGSTTAVVLLVLTVSIVVGSASLSKRLGGAS